MRIYDFDDTLAEFSRGFDDWFRKEYGLGRHDFGYSEPSQYDLLHHYRGLDREWDVMECLKGFEESKRIHFIEPNRIVIKDYIEASRTGEKSVILTARGWMEDPYFSVTEWFDFWDLPQPHDIHVVGINQSKSDVIAGILFENVEPKVIYEDSPKHLNEIFYKRPRGIEKVIAVDRGWNKEAKCDERLTYSGMFNFDEVSKWTRA